MTGWRALGLVVFSCLWATPAFTQTVADLKAGCLQSENTEFKLYSCTKLLESNALGITDVATTLNNRGNAWSSKGDREAALRDYTAAIAASNGNANAHFNRANTLALLSRYDEALLDYDRVLAIDPAYPNVHGFKGRVHQLKGNPEDAAKSYRSLLALDPGNSEARRRLADIEATLAKQTPALQQPDTGHDVALCKDAADMDACTRLLNAATLSGQSRSKVFILRAQIHLAQGNDIAAIADLSASIALVDSEDLAYALRAHAYVRSGERDKALADYGRAIALDPQQAAAYAARGSLHHLMGHVPSAIADLRKALEINPNLPEAESIRAQLAELHNSSVSAPVPAPAPPAPAVEPPLPATPAPQINTDIAGDLLARYPITTTEGCQLLCASDARCVAFTFNVWNDMCLLKSTARVLLVEPSSISGVARGRAMPAPSTTPVIFQRYRNRFFPIAKTEPQFAADTPACEAQCAAWHLCAAYTFVADASACFVFPYTDEYAYQKGAVSGVRRQVE